MPDPRSRRELYLNTIVSWAWAQGTLVASVLVLPLLTRLLTQVEFGLWTQLLSLAALSTVADFGMSAVFLRGITAPLAEGRRVDLKAAGVFYGTIGSLLLVVLLAVCLLPGGILAPFLGRTRYPQLTAILVIAAIVTNFTLQPYALRLLARGRVDLERVFGAGPAVVGTLATAGAAYWFGSALAVAAAYALVEVCFNAALVVLVRRLPALGHVKLAREQRPPWSSLASESWRVLTIGLTPQLTFLIDTVVVGHAIGPVGVAIYVVCLKVSDLIRRFFSPFTESVFISLCRSRGDRRQAVLRQATSLPLLITTSGMATGFMAIAVGPHILLLLFGRGYGKGEATLVILLVTATLQTMYTPWMRSLQADNALGHIPRSFLVGLIFHTALAVVLTERWGLPGTAVSVLLTTIGFELVPITLALRRRSHKAAPSRYTPLRQLGIGLSGMALVLIVGSYRFAIGTWSEELSVLGALACSIVAIVHLTKYLRSSRLLLVDT